MNKYIESIIEANNDNRLAIFVGAGVSKSSDSLTNKMPLWSDVVDALKNDLEGTKEQDFLKLAQLYYLEFGEYEYYKKLKGLFGVNLEPSNIHKLIFEIKPQYVITTNWDKLLDETVINNAFIYDIVTSDTDLVKSTTQKKLIKMHGDFEHHNVVFKEDDYLNYTKEFPLIENYIKSILSTHTVLFIGYSYSDYNLKQMVKWIQSTSTVRPPAYLVAFNSNNSERKYLNNHGITSLILDDEGDSNINTRIHNFLNLIKNQNYVPENVSDVSVVDYFYTKLLPFDMVNVLMPEQIQKVFKDIRLIYELQFIVLDFHNNTNEYYLRFLKILTHLDKDELSKDFLAKNGHKLNKVFEVLSKAGIGGISLSNTEYYPFNIEKYTGLNLNNLVEFKLGLNKSNSLENAFILYQLDSNEDSYNAYNDVIKHSLKTKDYIPLFLSMFNSNALLKTLKFSFDIDYSTYQNVPEFDIEEKYLDVPNNIRKAISPVIATFKDFTFLYSFAFKISSLLKEKAASRRSIEKGGLVFSNNSSEAELRHENLLYFILGNGLAIEKYTEFKTIIEYFINISITRQIQEDNIILNKLEVYSCIKYINEKDLKVIFEPYSVRDSKQKLMLDNDDQKLLLNILENVTSHMKNENTTLFPSFEEYWKKAIFLFALVKLNKENIGLILDNFSEILKLSKNSISIYQTINSFLGLQYHLYEEDIDDEKLIALLEVVLNKIVLKSYNGHEFQAIKDNYISNVYGYLEISKKKIIYTDELLISKLLLELNGWSTELKVEISKYFLISLYGISNKIIQGKIKEFILGIQYKKEIEGYAKVDFELFLLSSGFINDVSKDLISEIEEEIAKYRDGKSMSSTLSALKHRLDYLVDVKNITEFKQQAEEIKVLIENFDKKKSKSFF